MSGPTPEILVIDEHPGSLAWVVETLSEAGMRVRPADSGALGLASARLDPPDLVLLDVRMEGLDGYQVCSQLKADPATRAVPVIFMSGLGDLDDRVHGYEVGASDYLLKPLQKVDLLTRINTFLRLRKTEQRLHRKAQESAEIREQLAEELEFRFGAQTILDEAPVMVFAVDPQDRFLLVNRAVARPLGLAPEEIVGRPRTDFAPPGVAETFRANDLKVLARLETQEFEEHFPSSDGEHLYWSVKFPLWNRAGELLGVGCIATDITSLRRAERERSRLLDLYSTLSQGNKAILRSGSDLEVMAEICRVCVEFGHLDLAWVGVEDSGSIRPLASAGPAVGYLEGLEVRTSGESPLGQGPTGTAFREQRTIVVEDWAANPGMGPWRDRGEAFGIHSSASFPVRVGGEVEHSLNLYSRERGFFQPDRVALLEELADDLGYALDRFAEERRRQEAERALEEERTRYQKLVNTMPAGLYRIRFARGKQAPGSELEQTLGGSYRADFLSDRFCELLEIDRGAFHSNPSLLADRLHPEDRGDFLAGRAEAVRRQKPFRWEGRLKAGPGTRWVRFESFPQELEGGDILWTGMITEITEQKAARSLIDHQFSVLTAILESSMGPVFSVDREYRYTTFNGVHASVMKALYGCEIAEGMNLLECQSVAEDRAKAKANLDRALAGESVTEVALSGEDAHSKACFEVTHNPIRDKDGAITGVAVFAQDITERKRTEARILRLTNLLRHSDSLARVGGWEIDLATNELFWTDEIYHIYEVDPETYRPTVESSIQFYAPESVPVITEAVQEALRSGKNFDLELGLITGKGRRIQVRATSEVVYEEGRPVRLMGAFQDITEFKRTEELLRQSTDLLSQSESLARVGGWEVDLEANTLFWTDETYRIHDLEPGQFQPTVEAAIGFYAPEYRLVIKEAVRQAIEEGRTFDLELEIITAKGRRIWVHTNSLVTHRDGRITKVFGAFQDISREKEAWAALEASRERYRLLTENARDVVWTLDAETLRFTYVSPSVERLRGYTPEEIMAAPLDAALTPEGAELVRAAIHQRVAEFRSGGAAAGTFHVEEVEQPCKDGTQVWTEVVTSYYLDEGTGHVWVLGVTRDISKRRRAQEALAESEARHRAVVETTADGLVLLDRETARILDANPSFCAMYGYTLEELRGMTAMDVSAEPDQTRAATQQGSSRVGLRWHKRKDGTVFPVEMVANSFVEGGQTINVVSVRDITQRRALEEELLRLNRDLEQRVAQRTTELEATNKELEAFAYSVSHDLRAPLRAVAGFATALREDFDDRLDEEGREYLDRIQAGAVRMGHLIDDLLRLSRVGRGDLIFVPVDLAPMAREALARLQAEDPRRVAEVRIPESMAVECDPRLMRILLENLLGNAWKFSSKVPRSSIEITFARHDDGTHELVVWDNGVGFPMDRADKLFSPFHRLHSAEEFPGTGIGLAIVQRIAARHGGRAWAESSPGEGATFHVLLATPPKETP